MSEPYYRAEHVRAYSQLRHRGLTHWSDLHTERPADFDDFQGRDFLARVLPEPGHGRRLLEYGCGTGAAAIHLALRGYRVTALDLVPDAIAMARAFAAEREAQVEFAVQDVCRWPATNERFDVILDLFCLQSIVTDADRARLFAAVRRRLTPTGRYLVLTAMAQQGRDYGDDLRDGAGVVWMASDHQTPDGRLIEGRWHVPNRRHLTSLQLRTELEHHGFDVLDQGGSEGGEVVAARAG